MFISKRSIVFMALLLPALSAHAAKVSGTVTNSASGDPIAGARVILGSFGGGGSADTATTDAKGAYAFDSVSTGFHTLVASATGYQANTANVNALQAAGSYTANITLAPTNGGGQIGVINGTVKDDSTKEAIKGATVILSHPAGRGGPTPIDTVVTDGEGRFSFPVVPAATNYIVTASFTGYADAGNDNVDVANKDTVAVPLLLKKLPKPNSSVIGKVTDAGSKAAVSGATVILRRRATVGGAWTGFDTTTTDTAGNFKFEALAPATLGNPYSILTSKTDYNTATSGNIVVGANQTDTVNVALTKVAKGSMSIFVGLDSTGNPPLAGAEVAASLEVANGAVYTGTTDAKGWANFPSVIAGTYSVSANLAGFVSKVATRAVSADEKDTGYIYLARATAQNSKSLSGLVRDADGKAVAGAKVLFEANGANGITLSATSSATGDYSFSGIPNTVTGGTVTVSKAGFADFSGAVALGSQASFLNVTLKTAVGIVAGGRAFGRLLLVNDGSGLAAAFAASHATGTLSLYDARGSLHGAYSVPAGSVRASLRTSDLIGARFLVLRQGANTLRMALPARF